MIDYQAPRADPAQFRIDRAIIDQPTLTMETGHNGSQSDTDLQDAALKIHRHGHNLGTISTLWFHTSEFLAHTVM